MRIVNALTTVSLLSVLSVGCTDATPKKKASVIRHRTRRAGQVDVAAHVTGETVGAASAPAGADADQAAALAALGYVDVGEAAPADRTRGTAELDAERSVGGLNVYTTGGRAGAVAVDMAGTIQHRWNFQITDAWPGFSHSEVTPAKVPWRRAQVLPNGDLVGIWTGYGIVRITADSKLVWGHWLPVHHDLHVADDGSVVVLTTEFRDHPDLYDEPVADDHLVWLSPDGWPQRSVSLIDAFQRFDGFQAIWDARPKKDTEDVFHSNTVYVLDRDYSHVHPAFKAGRVLTSMRHLDALALVDPDTQSVVWAKTGDFAMQHDPQLTLDGSMWVFDNQGTGRNRSRLLRYSLATGKQKEAWGGDADHRLWTATCGHIQQLRRGNLLVVSSEQGVVYELDANRDVVWTYHVPDEIKDAGGSSRLARFFEFQRIEPGAGLEWLVGTGVD